MNRERLMQRFSSMAEIGQTDRGGVNRLALTEMDKQARDLLWKWSEEIGLSVRVDDFGNIYARLEGEKVDYKPVVLGSHLDSVPYGGKFDGTLGVLVGLELMETIIEEGKTPERPLELAVFTNEEGARFPTPMLGSGAVTGVFTKEHVYNMKDDDGVRFEDALVKIGYVGDSFNRVTEVEAFIELHIEQGPVLESKGVPVGIVNGIQGLSWHSVQFFGEAGHAGTTPLHHRKDPLISSVKAIQRIHDWVMNLEDETIVTFGKIGTASNTINVVSNSATFSLDIRHPDHSKLLSRIEKVKRLIREVALEDDTESLCEDLSYMTPVSFDPGLSELLSNACRKHNVDFSEIVSGAGHDAMYMNRIGKTVMVFAPSRAGKSHCEEEDTSWEDIEKAGKVMEDTVKRLAFSTESVKS
ncbi:Zn-dependent hydrolase [Halobacillus salinus]|uniref:Zn-dependent hydrolase n=1 Tax=Halobacillus salinus TaxID=192814 RepID=A0A4Z0H0A4_9BACI|nr:Zn-dependent hydrolase [Halobacillus salinus]TGB02463.1 Zn-dependent hydrolase [Halobacillus salinus]